MNIKSFKKYLEEVIIIPARTGNAEELPHGFSIQTPQEVIGKSEESPSKPRETPKSPNKPLTFRERLARARQMAGVIK